MHIPDGILPGQICAVGYALSGGVTWLTLRKIHRTSSSQAEIPKAAMLTAAFFVGSSISLPIPPVSVHLVLNGLLGAILGWYAWPAILVGLLLQALLLGHGGMTSLGINALIIGLPALTAFGVFELRHGVSRWLKEPWRFNLFAFLSGMTGLGLSTCLFFSLILFSIPAEFNMASEEQTLMVLLLSHLPVMLIEGSFTLMLAGFLRRINPELVEG